MGGGGITGGMFELGALSARGDGKDIPISKAIRASTAIPVFFEPVLIEDRFLQQAVIPAGRRRFGLKRQQSAAPAR
ncbi:MAG: hypothetical protein ACYC24_03005 [Desulfobacteria bacterium]